MKTAVNLLKIELPLAGRAFLASSTRGIVCLDLSGRSPEAVKARIEQLLGRCDFRSNPRRHHETVSELKKFLSGKETHLTAEVHMTGTEFQQKVWKQAMRIRRGKTLSYGELAKRLGTPGAARAVGNALGANPTPLFVPCHRVIRSNGNPGGFTAGAQLKRKLLALEADTSV